MALDAKSVGFVRPFAFNYVVGMLWLLALAALSLSKIRVLAVAAAVNDVAIALGAADTPDLVITFMLVIGGVVLPYCMSIALYPITNQIMQASSRIYERRRDAEAREADMRLDDAANAVLFGSNVRLVPTTQMMKILAIRQNHQSLADELHGTLDQVTFEGHLVVPMSLLIGAMVGRALPPSGWSAVAAIGVGLLVFVIGVMDANRFADNFDRRLNGAILLFCSKNTELPAPFG